MGRGLYKSIYGNTGQGLYADLYNMGGQKQPSRIQSQNIRLGEVTDINEFFMSNVVGVPIWLLSVVLLGFAFVYRRKNK